jgi:hypothetical protein
MSIVLKESMARYQSHAAISRSLLVNVDKRSLCHARWQYDNPEAPSEEMCLGSALHAAFLTPDELSDLVVREVLNRRTKPGRARFAQLMEEGKILLTNTQEEQLAGMMAALESHDRVKALFRDGDAEVSCYWEDKLTGLPLKARADYLRKDGIILDLKTTRDASPEGFRKLAWNAGYHMQASHYMDGFIACGVDVQGFIFVAIESEAPYAIGIYNTMPSLYSEGRKRCQTALQKISCAIASDSWEGYSHEPIPLTPPAWAVRAEKEFF